MFLEGGGGGSTEREGSEKGRGSDRRGARQKGAGTASAGAATPVLPTSTSLADGGGAGEAGEAQNAVLRAARAGVRPGDRGRDQKYAQKNRGSTASLSAERRGRPLRVYTRLPLPPHPATPPGSRHTPVRGAVPTDPYDRRHSPCTSPIGGGGAEPAAKSGGGEDAATAANASGAGEGDGEPLAAAAAAAATAEAGPSVESVAAGKAQVGAAAGKEEL